MVAKIPGAVFFIGTCFAALAIVGGAGVIFVEFRDHTNQFLGPVAMLSAGIALLLLTVLSEKPRRTPRVVVGLRNSLIALFAIVVVLAILLIFLGPFH